MRQNNAAHVHELFTFAQFTQTGSEKEFMTLRKCLPLFILLALLLAACGNEDSAPETVLDATSLPETAATATTEVSEPILGVATVDSVEIQMQETFPVQISVRARGALPNGCTSLNDVTTNRNGNQFDITISTLQTPADACTQALVPFEEQIDLDVAGLPAGSYTVNVNGRTGSFTLDVDNVPGAQPTVTPTETADSNMALINGRVWHDLCAVATDDAGNVAPSEGCIAVETETGFQANGQLEDGEPGLAGITVHLGEGECPATGLQTTETDEDGDYIFTDLAAGTYCITIDAADNANASILLPGVWSFPEDAVSEATVTVADGEVSTSTNFGWDFALQPAPEVDLATCTKSITFVDDVTVPDDTVFTPGTPFEKTWRLQNSGTCPWTTDYALTYIDGDLIPDETSIPLDTVVTAGQTVELSAAFTAPAALGTYRANWQISDADGQLFGIDGLISEAFWVQIVVGEAEATPQPNSGTIGGVVWEDICFLSSDGTPSAGCVEIDDSGFYRGDGTLINEPRLAGIKVTLTSEACTADGSINNANLVATAVTDSAGLYRFTGLDEGLYCVTINALDPDNINLLIPGDWTWPSPGVGRAGVSLDAGEQSLEVDFGWEFQ